MKKSSNNISLGITNQLKSIFFMTLFCAISFITFIIATIDTYISGGYCDMICTTTLKANPIIFIPCAIIFLIIYSLFWSKFFKKHLLKSIESGIGFAVLYIIIFILFIIINIFICLFGTMYKRELFTSVDNAFFFLIIIYPIYVLLYSSITFIVAYKKTKTISL